MELDSYLSKGILNIDERGLDDRIPVKLALILNIGLFIFVPVLGNILGVDPYITVPIVGVIYGVFALIWCRIFSATIVAVVITSTFAANVPLASTGYLNTMPGDIGPNLWFVYLPLTAAYVVLLYTNPARLKSSFGVDTYLLGIFVFWSIIGTILASPIRPDATIYFSIFILAGLLTFSLIKYSIASMRIRFRSAVLILLMTISGHISYALVQLLFQKSFALTQLGEPRVVRTLAEIQLGIFGTYKIGTFVTGFAGMSFHLAALTILILWVPFAYYWMGNKYAKYALVLPVAGAIVIRTTTSDSVRGAFIVSLVLLAVTICSQKYWNTLDIDFDNISNKVQTVAIGVVSLFIILLPSSKSGATSTTPISGGASTTKTGATSGPQGFFDSLSIPFFDLSNLSIRFQQYDLGIELFSQNLIVGIGLGNFKYYYAEALNPPNAWEIHNIYLNVLVETGIIGFILYFGSIGIVFYKGVKAVEWDTSTYNGLVMIALLCGLLGQLAIGMLDPLLLTKAPVFFPFWIALGAIAGQYAIVK